MIREHYRIPYFAASLVFLAALVLAGVLGTGASTGAAWIAAISIGCAGAASVAVLFRPLGFTPGRWESLFVLAATGYLLSRAVGAPVAHAAREDVVLVALAFLAYACFLTLCADWPSRRRLIFGLAGLVGLHLVVAAVQGAAGPGFWPWPGYERHGGAGVSGLFMREGAFGAYLAGFLPLWLALAAFGRSARSHRLLWAGLAAASAAVLAAGGGGALGRFSLAAALLASAGLTLWLLWRRLKPSARVWALAAWAAAALIGAAWTAHPGGARTALLSQAAGLEASASGATAWQGLWAAGWRHVGDAPWSGSGSRSYSGLACGAAQPAGLPDGTDTSLLRNEYLQALVEYGAIGLLLVLAAVALHLRRGLRFLAGYRRPSAGGRTSLPKSDHLAAAFGAIGGLATFGAAAAFESLLHLPAFATAAAVLLACLAAPDPMADAAKPARPASPLRDGGMLFAMRSVAFGFGLSLAFFSLLFARSEHHLAIASRAFESEPKNFRRTRDLDLARRLDPIDPRAQILSARVQLAAIEPGTAPATRLKMLERAEEFFAAARQLDPGDPFPAPAHAEVLDALGARTEARQRLEIALEAAPEFGFLHVALARHHLRHGRVSEAELAYRASLEADRFRAEEAARQGLRSISEWKLIAESRGQRWDGPEAEGMPAEEAQPFAPLFPGARIDERATAGKAPGEEEHDR